MNIGIVTTWFERGAAYVSRQFMNVLQKTDNVFIYARGGETYAQNDPKWDLPNVWWGKKNNVRNAAHLSGYIDKQDFINWIKSNNLDLIIFNEQRYYQPILWANELGVKSVAYVDYYTADTLSLFDLYDCVICNTKRHSEAMRNHKNPVYIKWGTDINLYKPTLRNNDKPVFFHSAGMSPLRKGTDLLLKAFHSIPEHTSGKLLIHSQVDLMEQCASCQNEIKELLADGSLEIIEKTVTAPGLYFMGDVYVYPSRLDGIGLTLMEAAASGMPIITIDNPPMNEFVLPSFGSLCEVEKFYYREDGYYWPMSDASINSLATILKEYLSGNLDIQSMKESARQYAEEYLDFDKNMSVLSDLLSKITLTDITDDLKSKAIQYDKSQFSLKKYIRASIKKMLISLPGINRILQTRRNAVK